MAFPFARLVLVQPEIWNSNPQVEVYSYVKLLLWTNVGLDRNAPVATRRTHRQFADGVGVVVGPAYFFSGFHVVGCSGALTS